MNMAETANGVNRQRFKIILKLARKCLDELEESANKSNFTKLMGFDDVIACVIDEMYSKLTKAPQKYKLAK